MSEKKQNLSRREFFKRSSIATFGLSPLVSFLSGCINFSEPQVEDWFSDELHYFDDNLSNIHFYFINAQIKGERLTKKTVSGDAFMVVKIPQQHISERLLRESAFQKKDEKVPGPRPYLDDGRNTDSRISGFSYLAFKLFNNTSEPLSLETDDIKNLFDWNNRKYFELIIPPKESYTTITGAENDGKCGDRDAFEKYLLENHLGVDEAKGRICDFYKAVCEKLFKGSDGSKAIFPVTVLEIPQGLFVTPYTGDTKDTVKAVFSEPGVAKRQFIYQSDEGKMTRSVQEIWSAQMWFQQFQQSVDKDKNPIFDKNGNPELVPFKDKHSPSLRPAGYVNDQTGDKVRTECPESHPGFLPELIDKKELTYIASLGRKNAHNEGKEWNIETKGLTFTGLGAIAKFHYKNFAPPLGTDLAEYEHHITLGRDEYIKVARIGVISVTGQRALHIKIGQRKIKNGVSYMDFKEYIEIVQKEIKYFDEKLFIEKPTIEKPVIEEPLNYIHARNHPPYLVSKEGFIHSYDDDDDVNKAAKVKEDDVWMDRTLWETREWVTNSDKEKPKREKTTADFLPGKWKTHYRRWPFKSASSVSLVSPPIDSCAPEAMPVELVVPTEPRKLGECIPCVGAFWPVLEQPVGDTRPDCELSFTGTDWNNNPVNFTSTFLFIRKVFIEGVQDDARKDRLAELYDNFAKQKDSRRHILFTNSEISFTRDFIPTEKGAEETTEELENKSNTAKTDFLEYYFSICRESLSDGTLLELVDGKIQKSSTPILACSAFNERAFPLFPQVKRVQLYIENIQGYSSEPLPSIIEYNPDFITYGFERSKDVPTVIHNKGRLIFDHTAKFLVNGENPIKLGEKQAQVVQRDISRGYEKIKQAFGGAGDKIGGMVNPDFDIQSVGLVKQGIAIGKDFNEKYAQVTKFAGKVEAFNPSDLFRQSPEIFNGISLTDILKEVFPEAEGPINEIKNIAGQIETIQDSLLKHPLIDSVQDAVKAARKTLNDLKTGYETFQAQVESTGNQLKGLKDELDKNFTFPDLQNLIDNFKKRYELQKLEKLKEAVEGLQSISPADLNARLIPIVNELSKFIASNLLSKIEAIDKYRNEVNIKFFKVINQYPQIKSVVALHLNELEKKYVAIRKMLFTGPTLDQLKEFSVDSIVDGKEVRSVVTVVTEEVLQSARLYHDFLRKASTLAQEKQQVVVGRKNEVAAQVVKTYTDAKNLFEQPVSDIKSEIMALKETVRTKIETLDKFETPILTEEVNSAGGQVEQLRKLTAEERNKLESDLRLFESRAISIYETILTTQFSYLLETFDTLEREFKVLERKTGDVGAKVQSQVTGLKIAIDEKHSKLVRYFSTNEYLKDENLKDIKNDIQKIIREVNGKVEDVEDIVNKAIDSHWNNAPVVGTAKKTIADLETRLNKERSELQTAVKTYEDALKKQLSEGADNVVGVLKQKIRDLERQAREQPGAQDILDALARGRQFYNILTSLEKKEINYKWETSSFKEKDFGIVSFIPSVSPKTSLTVDVKSTIHFQANQFPPVVSKVDVRAENRLRNFGISLMKSMTIGFSEASFVVGTDEKPKFDVKIRGVEFSGALSFVQAFESWLQSMLGDAFRLKLMYDRVNIGYTLPIPDIKTPSFSFFNLTLNFDFFLYFDKRPLQLAFSLARRDNKFGIAVGAYAGFGYFSLIAEPKRGLVGIEIGLEYGGYFGLSIGPLRGEVKLVVGLYYENKKDSGVVIEGYILCEGRVLLWIVTLTVRYYMGVTSQGGYVEGRCTVTHEVKLGAFFKRSFTVTYYKKIAGASGGSGGGQSNSPAIASGGSSSMLTAFGSDDPSPQALLSGAPEAGENSADLQSEKMQSDLTRKVRLLTSDEWKIFINSYN